MGMSIFSRENPMDSGEEPVPYHFIWWVILLSFFVSLIGSVTTVEFLHRRRVGQGLTSQLYLGACAVSFGLVAIWCMHFVGNRSIVLGNGESKFQLYYNGGYTALSAILPIIFLYFGFFLVDRYSKSQRAMYMSLVGTGLAAGLSITGMHYVGNLGASNYYLYNKPGHIVAAASIAVVACWFSFTMFFRQKELWINSWYRRFMCAVLLACAVSGMHWTASVGTLYYRRRVFEGSEEERNRNVIVATALCMTALLCCVSLMYITDRRRRQLADRAQHVVLASFMVDPEGRVLVTQEGLLPCQKITRQYNQRSFNDEFNVSHPVFQWIYRVTHHWSGVADLIPTMKSHLRATGALRSPSRPGTSGVITPWEGHDSGNEDDYSATFREQFCVAAQDLADSLRIPLEKLGTLYEDLMMTGVGASKFKKSGSEAAAAMEAGHVTPALFGKGQVLFVINHITRGEASRLSEHGYRYAHIERTGDKVLEIMGRSMQVKKEDLLTIILRMKQTINQKTNPEPPFRSGTHVSCFVLRPPLKTAAGWELLVNKERPDQIPSIELTEDQLDPSQIQILQRLDGFTYNQCLNQCDRLSSEVASQPDREFYRHLWKTFTRMQGLVPDPFLRHALFCASPVAITAHTALYTFCAIPDVHASSLPAAGAVCWTPFSFFRTRLRTARASPDHAILARRNHIEFGSLLANLKSSSHSPPSSLRKQSIASVQPKAKFNLWTHFGRDPTALVGADSSSEKGLVRTQSREELASSNPFGGIMVSQDITVDTSVDALQDKDGVAIEMRDLGVRSEAGVADSEKVTWVDMLFRLTSAKWAKP